MTIKTPEGNNSPALASLIQLTILNPACSGSVTPEKPCAMAAPANPPIKVCEEEEGMQAGFSPRSAPAYSKPFH